ncbi:MAG: preprotein translocase subunit SecG [Candidatus Marinamargulisbacteria bacterium]
MEVSLLILEIISGILLIGAILLHSPKSEGMGAIGGQSRSFKAPTDDMESGLKKLTFIFGLLFFGSAVLLGLFF